MPHPLLVKSLIVAGSLLASVSGAYRDNSSTKLALSAGAVEIGHPRVANVVTFITSGTCIASLFSKRVTPTMTAVMCGGAISSGVARNMAANSNRNLNRKP